MPKERHPWSEDSADIGKLYEVAEERQRAWLDAQDQGYDDEDAYLDDVIPMDVPLSPWVAQMRADIAASNAERLAGVDTDRINARISAACAARPAVGKKRRPARRKPATPPTPWVAPWAGLLERVRATAAQRKAA